MCGIYGYIGKLNAFEEVLNGLNLLQYRGYDSCGIAYHAKRGFKIEKAVGTLSNLKRPRTSPSLAFGHTRWATNGVVSLENAHPHVSYNNEFVVVHNGIINNAEELKNELQKKNITFYSQTDTEVIANLLADMNGEIDKRVLSLFNLLKGSFSLIIGHKSGVIYAVKRFSPLNILKCADGIYISSDSASLKSGEIYSFKDFDTLKIENGVIHSLNDFKLEFKNYENDTATLSLNGFKHFMKKEIFETPKAILNTYNNLSKQKNILKIFKKRKKITMLACGTAYHSCLIGMELLKEQKFEMSTALASNYKVRQKIKKSHLHIIVSQSGETADCIKVAENIKTFGGKILLITNEARSSLTQFADYLILTKAGKEIAVASTKTYCCQIFTFAYITMALNNQLSSLDINKLTQDLEVFISSINMQSLAKQLKDYQNMILVGRDVDYITLLEASLKIREIDYVYTLPMYSGELKHGTLSLINENSLVITLNTDANSNKLKTVINEICSRGGEVVEFENYINVNEGFLFKPIFNIIPFQLLSYEIAIEKGLNPDMPRNLAKSVTVE